MRQVKEYRYLENTSEDHYKFYEIVLTATDDGFEVKGRWGRIGQRATEQIKYNGTSEVIAISEVEKTLRTRIQHGYALKERQAA